MAESAQQPRWEQHPLWLDRERLDAITERMWIEIQKTMFPFNAPRPRRRPGDTELTVVGGRSVDDVFAEALFHLLRYQPAGDVKWEAVGITIAHRRAVAAVRKAKKHRSLPDGSEISIVSLDLENDSGQRLVDEVPDVGDEPGEEATDRVLRADRMLAFREVANEALSGRDKDILFRSISGETNVRIAADIGLTPQRVGQIYRESLRKINARLRGNPSFRRLYEYEGGTSHDQ